MRVAFNARLLGDPTLIVAATVRSELGGHSRLSAK